MSVGPNVPFPPMEAELVEALPVGDRWQYEPKWDGSRGVLKTTAARSPSGAGTNVRSSATSPSCRATTLAAPAIRALTAAGVAGIAVGGALIGSGALVMGIPFYFSGYVVFSVGMLLLGIALLRVRAIGRLRRPRSSSGRPSCSCSRPTIYVSNFGPPFAAAWIWIGVALTRRRVPASVQ